MKTGILSAVAMAVALACASPAAIGAPVTAIKFAQESSVRKPDPAARYGRLPNGMTYIIQPNKTPAGTAAIYLRVAAGALMETDAQKGLAHFVEHMAFNGTENIPEGELRRRLERHGFAFGADTNAFTFDSRTVYMLQAPKTDAATLDEALFILREVAGNIRFDAAAVERERGVILAEERLRTDAAARRNDKWNRWLYAGTRYADHANPIGTVDIIKSAPPSQLQAFYDSWYRPELTTLIVAGDVDADAMEARIKGRFSDWQGRGAVPEEPDWGTRPASGVQTFSYEEKGLTEEMSLNWISPPEMRGDTPERVREVLTDNYLRNLVNTRLSDRALQSDSAFFAASVGYYQVPKTAQVNFVSIIPKPGHAKDAFAQAYAVIHALRAQGVTKAEVRKLDQTIGANISYLQGSQSTRDSTMLAGTLLSALDANLVAEGPQDGILLLKTYRKDIASKTGLDSRLAAWFGGDGPILSHTAESLNGYDEAAMRADYDSLSGAQADSYTTAKSKSWPYGRFFAPKVAPVSQTRDADFAFTRYVWPNGVTLHIMPTKLVANQINVQVDFAGGQQLFDPKTAPPLFLAASDFLYSGGLNKLSQAEFSDALRNYQVGVNYTLTGDMATLSGVTNPGSINYQIEALLAYATDAAYRPDPFDRYVAWVPEYLRTLRATPEGVRAHNWTRILHGDPRFDETRLERIDSITNADIRAIFSKSLTDTPIHITIVGDVDENKAVAEIGKTFGALPPRPAKPAVAEGADRVAFPPSQRQITLHHEGRSDQAMSIALWPTDDFPSDPRAARAETLLAAVMSNRLQDELRESQGADYAPTAFAYNDEVYQHLGMIGVVSAVRAGADADFRKAVDGIVADLKTRPVADDELDRARKPMLAALDNEGNAINYWTFVLSRLANHPQMRADWLERRKHFESVTPKDLMDLSQRYLKDDTVIAITIEPEPSAKP